jgi:hypothetical protein
VAGTLVHTDAGPRPIETLKAGDMVLARGEGGGSPSLRRIVRTCVSENMEIVRVGYRTGTPRVELTVFAGVHQPIRLEPDGWTVAQRLRMFDDEYHLVLADGSDAVMNAVENVWATDRAEVGWIGGSFGTEMEGELWDFGTGRCLDKSIYYDLEWEREDWQFRTTLYAIELEQDHGYFAGDKGIWVADAAPEAGNRPEYADELLFQAQQRHARAIACEAAAAALRYEDGEPVREGDAVLLDHGLVSGRVTGFLFSGDSVELMRVDVDQPGERAVYVDGGVVPGVRLLERGSPSHADAAVRILRERAEAGDAAAMFAWGGRHVNGVGVPQDRGVGLSWLRKAAMEGHAQAQYLVGFCYENGKGVEPDVETALFWYQQAALQDQAQAWERIVALRGEAPPAPRPWWKFW